MSTNDDNIHLLSLDDYNDFETSSNESEDDSTEVVSNVDEEENQIVNMTKYLAFTSSSDDESKTNGDDNHCSTFDINNNNRYRSSLNNIVNHYSSRDNIGNPSSSCDVVVIDHNPTFDVSNNNCCRPDNINNHYSPLDVADFSIFKNHSDDIETLKSVDFIKAFQDIGCIWIDNSPVTLRSMPAYTFDPTSVDYLSLMDDEYDDEDRIDIIAQEASQQQQRTQIISTQTKQLTLIDM